MGNGSSTVKDCPKCEKCEKCEEQTECETCEECEACPTRPLSCIAKRVKAIFEANDLTFNASDYSNDSQMLKDLKNKVSVEAMLKTLKDCAIEKSNEEDKVFNCISGKIAPVMKTELGIDFDVSQSTSVPKMNQILDLDVFNQLSAEAQYNLFKDCAPELKDTTESFIGGINNIFLLVIVVFLFINRKKILKLIA